MQGATVVAYFVIFALHDVSIHAPYAGSDTYGGGKLHTGGCFNPRPLCRERLPRRQSYLWREMFQSTPPMQGATEKWGSSAFISVYLFYND